MFPAGQQGEKLVIPEDLKTTCPLCSGLGKIKRGSFARPNTDITKVCHNCHSRGWIWKRPTGNGRAHRARGQLADEELVFNHANETIGKLEADLQEARKVALEEAARIADKIGEQAADDSAVSPLNMDDSNGNEFVSPSPLQQDSNTANALPAIWTKALSAEKERIWKARGSTPKDRRKGNEQARDFKELKIWQKTSL